MKTPLFCCCLPVWSTFPESTTCIGYLLLCVCLFVHHANFKHSSLCLGVIQDGTLPPAQVANVTGVSRVLSAHTYPAPAQGAPKTALKNKPLGPVQYMSNVQSQPKPILNQAMKTNNEDNHPPQ